MGLIIDHDVLVEKRFDINVGAICEAGSLIKTERKLEVGEVIKGY